MLTMVSIRDYLIDIASPVLRFAPSDNSYVIIMVLSYGLFLIVCVAWFAAKWIFCKYSASYREIQQAHTLCKAVSENNILAAARIVESCPGAVNVQFKPDGYTPFLKACLQGNTQLVKVMLIHGADLNIRTFKGESPFYLAVYNLIKNPLRLDASCIHALYHFNADINECNKKGFAPIQMAAIFGHTSLVRWLMTKGVNLQVVPTPYMLARSQGHHRTASVLKMREIQ